MDRYLSRWLSFFLLIVVLLVLNGCAKPGPKYTKPLEIPSGKSVVYFYRQAHLLGTMAMPGIKSNGQEILYTLPTWSWWPYYIEPGNYHFEPKLFGLYKKDTVNITSTKPGEKFYVRLSANIGYVGLNLVEESQAIDEMKKCYLVEGNDKKVQETSPEKDLQQPTTSLESIEPKVARLYVDTNHLGHVYA